MTPAVAMRIQRIQRIDDALNNGNDINDNESDESDSTDSESSDEEEDEVAVPENDNKRQKTPTPANLTKPGYPKTDQEAPAVPGAPKPASSTDKSLQYPIIIDRDACEWGIYYI